MKTDFRTCLTCLTCHFYHRDHATCGCGTSPHRGEFVQPDQCCEEWVEVAV